MFSSGMGMEAERQLKGREWREFARDIKTVSRLFLAAVSFSSPNGGES
jgi:hypothetical protein